jgi:histidine triad (HIT) family protein
MAYYYSPFRKEYYEGKHSECAFCDSAVLEKQSVRRKDRSVVENEYYIWFVSFYPKFEGHTLIIPKQHVSDIDQESPGSIVARNELLILAKNTLQKLYPGSGLEVFLQTGEKSDASIAHLHWHIVPAQPDDVLRGFDKLGHFYTTKPNEEKVVLFPIEVKLAKEELLKALSQVL